MKIGLVRHFEVDCPMPDKLQLITPGQYRSWLDEYNGANIKARPVDSAGIKWERCYSSDMRRAVQTAHQIYDGPIVAAECLRELVIYPPSRRNIRLPALLWLVSGRLAWMFSHPSQPESREAFSKRLRQVMQTMVLNQAGNVLLVSHSGLMMFLRRELLRKGFHGPSFLYAEHGRIYVFERQE